MKFKIYKSSYDRGLNLIQQGNTGSSHAKRMIVCQDSNRSIDELVFNSLTPQEKANLDQSLLAKNIFDVHGNQLRAGTISQMGWNSQNMLQSTITGPEVGSQLREYNVYAKPGQRSMKVTKKTDPNGNTIEIREALYLGNLEYRTTWKGINLSFDGEIVTEASTGDTVAPYEKYMILRIRQGPKQVARKIRYTYKAGFDVDETKTTYTLDNNIDSCEMNLNNEGKLESYETYTPYGEAAVSYGRTDQQPYKYSGQEKDQSGLYYYGFRSYLPANFRWMKPDPAGMQGSGLNWYAMVKGNPVTMRDSMGLGKKELIYGFLRNSNSRFTGEIYQLVVQYYPESLFVGILDTNTLNPMFKALNYNKRKNVLSNALDVFKKEYIKSGDLSKEMLFAAPEFLFSNNSPKRRGYNVKIKKIRKHENEMKKLSIGMTLVPGTITYNMDKNFYNTMYVFQNGSIIHKYHKKFEPANSDTLKNDSPFLESIQNKTEQEFILFNKQACAEICFDVTNRKNVMQNNEDGFDYGILVSASMISHASHIADGGIFIHADAISERTKVVQKSLDYPKIESQSTINLHSEKYNVNLKLYSVPALMLPRVEESMSFHDDYNSEED